MAIAKHVLIFKRKMFDHWWHSQQKKEWELNNGTQLCQWFEIGSTSFDYNIAKQLLEIEKTVFLMYSNPYVAHLYISHKW